jgi:hypothetical protein
MNAVEGNSHIIVKNHAEHINTLLGKVHSFQIQCTMYVHCFNSVLLFEGVLLEFEMLRGQTVVILMYVYCLSLQVYHLRPILLYTFDCVVSAPGKAHIILHNIACVGF